MVLFGTTCVQDILVLCDKSRRDEVENTVQYETETKAKKHVRNCASVSLKSTRVAEIEELKQRTHRSTEEELSFYKIVNLRAAIDGSSRGK